MIHGLPGREISQSHARLRADDADLCAHPPANTLASRFWDYFEYAEQRDGRLTGNLQQTNGAERGASRTLKRRLCGSGLRFSLRWQNAQLHAPSRSPDPQLKTVKQCVSRRLAKLERRAASGEKALEG